MNAWGCMEILPTHCGAGSVKVNYYRCMRKILGLVKPHKVNKRHMRLSYCRIYFNMKKHKQPYTEALRQSYTLRGYMLLPYTNKAFTSKNRFQNSVIFVVF